MVFYIPVWPGLCGAWREQQSEGRWGGGIQLLFDGHFTINWRVFGEHYPVIEANQGLATALGQMPFFISVSTGIGWIIYSVLNIEQ